MATKNTYTSKNDINFDSNSNSNSYNDNDIDNDTFSALAPYKQAPETKIKNHIVIINSIDRNWYNYPNETPYNYLVKLGGSATDQYSTVSHDYKNVVEFAIDKIILPNRPCIQSYNSNIAPRLNDYPYITMNITGINFSSYGTNKTLNNTIGIFTPLFPLPKTLSDVSYLEFKNTSIQKKEYYQNPEGYISLVDLNITTPNGTQASNINDILSIYSIFLNTSNTVPLDTSDTLVIQTSTYFNNVEFKQNDLIKMKNYVYHNMSYDESGQFNSWINRDSGHYILDIVKSNLATSLYNQIIIPIPATLSRTTGNIAVESWFSSFVNKSLSNIAIADTSGKLINASTQSHLVVNIKTLEKNDIKMFFKDL